MRCPRCGYISFDNLVQCKKCKKKISKAENELAGTVYDVAPPSMLFSAPSPPVREESVEDVSLSNLDKIAALPVEDIEVEEDLFLDDDKDIAEDVSFSVTEDREQKQDGELALDLDLDLALGEEEQESAVIELKEPSFDMSALDISDLQVPSSPPDDTIGIENETILDIPPNSPQIDSVRSHQAVIDKHALEDLQLGELSTNASSAVMSEASLGKSYLPSMKTGTALDSFTIELDDLLENEIDEKA